MNDITEIKKIMLENISIGNHITTTILINCINQLVVMIPDDDIRHLIEETITECEDVLEKQEQ